MCANGCVLGLISFVLFFLAMNSIGGPTCCTAYTGSGFLDACASRLMNLSDKEIRFGLAGQPRLG